MLRLPLLVRSGLRRCRPNRHPNGTRFFPFTIRIIPPIPFLPRPAVLAASICAFLACFANAPAAADAVRVAVLKFGTVNWELDVVRHHGLDKLHGVDFEIALLTNKDATAIALLSDAADIIVTDWIWVSRQRQAGKDFTLIPYSNAAGSIMAHPDSGIETVDDLMEGSRRLGVAGSSIDKSWLLVRAFGLRTAGRDLADTAELAFGAPPLLNQMLLRKDLDAVLTFWNFTAQLRAQGMREILPVPDVLPSLGVGETLPLIGYVFSESWARSNPDVLTGFLAATGEARRILATDDGEWERIRKRTGAKDDAMLHALRDAFRAGIPDPNIDSSEAIERAFAVLADIGGRALVGEDPRLAAGSLWPSTP